MAQRVTQLVCLLAATSLAACGHATTNGKSTTRDTPAPTPSETPGWTAATLTNGGSSVRIEHPTAWRFVKSDAVYLGSGSVAGYFTNAATVPQCHTKYIKGGEQIDCNGPVPRLNPGQVLVTVGNRFMIPPNTPFTSNTVVDGLPAASATLANPQNCPAGAGEARTLDVQLDRGADPTKALSQLIVTVCLGQGGGMPYGGAPVGDVEKMLQSINVLTTVHG